MSLAPCHPALRARVSGALNEVLESQAARALGRQLGHAGHTITERGADLGRWPLIDALLLAAEHDGLREALIACLQGTQSQPAGQSTAAFGELMKLIHRDCSLQADIAAAVADGNLSGAEALQVRRAILARRAAEDKALLSALDACGAAGGR